MPSSGPGADLDRRCPVSVPLRRRRASTRCRPTPTHGRLGVGAATRDTRRHYPAWGLMLSGCRVAAQVHWGCA